MRSFLAGVIPFLLVDAISLPGPVLERRSQESPEVARSFSRRIKVNHLAS
jgi:hypothetical protein